jgi:hypothetical protein
MKPGIRSLLAASLLAIPLTLTGQVTIKNVAREADLPEVFAPGWKAGDFVLTAGRFLVLIGGSPRPRLSTLNSPVTDGKGGILSFVPADQGLDSTLNIGGPLVRRGRRAIYPAYAEIRILKGPGSGKGLTLEATAEYAGKTGKR